MALNRLGKFVILNGTYFSGYDTGDEIICYYNDTLGTLEVYRNGTLITSGPVISSWHVSNNYVTGKVSNFTFCDGSDLISFTDGSGGTLPWFPSFPYFLKQSQKNSPSCGIIICDITFKGSPVIVEATPALSDGSITVSVSSSSVVKFSTTFNQDYNAMQAADSVASDTYTKTFSNLSKGTYTIYTKDANNCETFRTVVVEENTFGSYGAKYFFDFRDWQNLLHKCTIKETGYSGANTELDYSGSTPVNLIWGSTTSQGKLNNILGGSIELELVSESNQQWANIFKAVSEKQFLVEITQGANVIQRGYVIPDTYDEPWEKDPYIVSLRAADGIADLSNKFYTVGDYSEDTGWKDGQRVTGISSIIEILTFCLQKTGINQGIRSCVNVYADEQNSAATDDPLAQTYLDNSSFITEDDKPLTCQEVIRMVLSSFPEPSVLFSANGLWWVFPVDQRTSTVDYRDFSLSGAYSANGTITSITDIDNISKGAGLQFGSVYKDLSIVEHRKLAPSLFKEFKPENIQGGLPIGWTPILNGESGSWRMDWRDEYLIADFSVFDGNGRSYVTNKSTSNSFTPNDKINVKIDYNIATNVAVLNLPYVKMRWMLKAGSKYLAGSGEWVTYKTVNEQIVSTYDTDVSIEITTDMIESVSSSDIEFRLYSVNGIEHDFELNYRGIGTIPLSPLANEDIDDWLGSGESIPAGYKTQVRVNRSEDVLSALGPGFGIYYYSLQVTSQNIRNPNIVGVTAGTRDAYYYRWILDDIVGYELPFGVPIPGGNFPALVKYKNATVNIYSAEEPDETVKVRTFVSGGNNVRNLAYDMGAFDLASDITNGTNSVINYWRLSTGNPISLGWNSADLSVNNSNSQTFVLNYLLRLFKFPTKTLNLTGRQDTHVFPYHIMRMVTDNNTIYKWNRLEWNMKMMMFSGELSELGSDTVIEIKAYKDNSYSNGYS